MLHRLILKVTEFQLPPPKRLSTVVEKIFFGGHNGPPMSNRVKFYSKSSKHISFSTWFDSSRIQFCCLKTDVENLKIFKQWNKSPLFNDLSTRSTFLGHLVVRV